MKKNLMVFGFAFVAIGIPSYLHIRQSGFDEESFRLMLRATARIALATYLLVFIARPLRQISVSGIGKWLLRNRRYLGITFAAVMTVHLIYLVWLNGVQPVIPGIIAFVLVYLMLVTSFNGPAAALGPRRWRALHKTGLYFVGIVFAFTMIRSLREAPTSPLYLSMALLMLIAAGIRVAAHIKTRGSTGRTR